jgi:hypothetical protein
LKKNYSTPKKIEKKMKKIQKWITPNPTKNKKISSFKLVLFILAILATTSKAQNPTKPHPKNFQNFQKSEKSNESPNSPQVEKNTLISSILYAPEDNFHLPLSKLVPGNIETITLPPEISGIKIHSGWQSFKKCSVEIPSKPIYVTGFNDYLFVATREQLMYTI